MLQVQSRSYPIIKFYKFLFFFFIESESFRGLPNGAVCSESTFSNGRQGRSACSTAVAMCKQNEGQGIGYAASDTGVSSMYSDECDEVRNIQSLLVHY